MFSVLSSMNELFTVTQVVIISCVTAFIRFLSFIIFKDRETPKLVSYLGTVLPMAIIGMLVVFCFKSVELTVVSDWLPAAIAAVIVVVLHVWRRNTLLSILGGTVIYMALVNLAF